MTRKLLVALVAGAVLVAALGLSVIMVAGVIGGADSPGQSSEDCGVGNDTVVPVDQSGGSLPQLDDEQTRNARIIVAVGRDMGISARGLIVAIATAMQESTLRNLDYGDRDSLGLFQQRPSAGWGTPAQITDPQYAARKFFNALKAVAGWEQMPVTVAAQTVQRSAFPDAYAKWERLAENVVAGVPSSGGAAAVPVNMTCSPVEYAAGTVVWPLPKQFAGTDRHNYGGQGGRWSNGHTGTDFSVACGTPVLAATGGQVVIDTSQSWSGRWLVKVTTGAGKLTTWYAHMQALTVSDGDTVSPGQQIGEVGTLGNSTGCHLHFEVHPKNGGIYEDGINPSPWLEQNVGKNLGGPATVPASQGSGSLVLASFNVLGASHTGGEGKLPGMASGADRIPGLLALLDRHDVQVVGLQEFQGSQARAFRERAAGWQLFYPGGDTENAIAWRSSIAAKVSGGSIAIPYFDGHLRRMPYVRLRFASGQEVWFANFHNPADTRRYPNQDRYRAEAVRREVALATRLRATGAPVFFTGDFNERASFFCKITANGQMRAAAGGSVGRPCSPPAYNGIDWILGSSNVRFTGHTVDRSALVRQTSDHPLIVASVQ